MNLDYWLNLDKELLLLLNGSSSLFWDNLMWDFSGTVVWIPAGLVLFFVIIKNNSVRQAAVILLFIAFAITVADQFSSSFCKPFFARHRPSQDPELMQLVDVVRGYRGGAYGFISSHAANTFALATFLAFLMRRGWVACSLFLWALLCSYSRIYLGVHYPGDILFGLLWGVVVGSLCYALCSLCLHRMSLDRNLVSSQYTSSGYAVVDLDLMLTVLYLTYFGIVVHASAVVC